MNFTPSSRGTFLAGIGLWCLIWAAAFKLDEIADLGGLQQWFSTDRCFRWINGHRSATLLGTELFNYSTHGGISDPLGVTFALGGTCVNLVVIYVLIPLRERAMRRLRVRGL